MKVGIYGGTFNPPHIGHVRSAAAAARQLGLDRLIVVPVGVPPHKPLAPETPKALIRLEMVRLSFSKTPNAVVSDIEIVRSEPSYTVDTVSAIKNEYSGAELFLLLGTDMYLTLDTWKGSGELLNTATPAVFSRGEDDGAKISRYSAYLSKSFGVRTEIITSPVTDISSSRLREILPERGGSGYITDTNYSYILKNRLYGARAEFDWLRYRAYSMLDPGRIRHVAGCEREAVRLARRWGESTNDAREAAILHDVTKRLDTQSQLELCRYYGIGFPDFGMSEEKLLHAKTGAAIARSEFGVSDKVYNAILWHTTGRADMSALEKIIYIADYIEPERNFGGVDRLRQLAYEDIDAALIEGLEMTIADMKSRGITPNGKSLEAIIFLKDKRGLNSG